MRSRSMFHTFVVFMLTLLIFGVASDTRAQQNSEQTEVPEITAAEDVKTVRLTAKAAAEQDATDDVNRLLWFGAGMGTAAISLVGMGAGCCMSFVVIRPESSDLPYAILGMLIGGSVPLIGIYNYFPANPPPERLLGKSPEYVEFYTDAYRKKTRLIRTQQAVAGTAAGWGVIVLVGLGL